MEQVKGPIACLTGIAPWKRARITAMLAGHSVNQAGPPHCSDPAKAVEIARKAGGALACWASRVPDELPALCQSAGVDLWRIEDGFVRSAGLGVSLVQPCSITLDTRGVHYDPSRPSDLEYLLENHDFTEEECARASRLIDQLIASDITKYNLAGERISLPDDRPIVLVIGQVDDDRSMQLGGKGMTTRAMLSCARKENPDGFIIYRPHPDVTAGLRQGMTEGAADLIAADAPITQLIAAADEVHTISSLAGFEALLRGCKVVAYGGPFYAGWGLCDDRATFPRRTCQLTLPELVAGALISYPIYADPQSGQICEVEQLAESLASGAAPAPLGLWRRIISKAALGWVRLSRPSGRE